PWGQGLLCESRSLGRRAAAGASLEWRSEVAHLEVRVLKDGGGPWSGRAAPASRRSRRHAWVIVRSRRRLPFESAGHLSFESTVTTPGTRCANFTSTSASACDSTSPLRLTSPWSTVTLTRSRELQ